MRSLMLAAALGLAALPSMADSGWFESGDLVLRNDLLLLNDAEVIRLPVGQWPLPREAVRHALEHARDAYATNAAVAAALQRVRARVHAQSFLGLNASIRGGRAARLRDFDTIAREEGELQAGLSYSGERFSLDLDVTSTLDPSDGKELRVDGSHATVQLGNWLLSASTLDRWWGPGHESSLILSNNARPMPTFMVERAVPEEFQSRWLRWVGPWRFHFAVSQMETEREDIDRPLFMAWRVLIMPFDGVEIGFSRTAQFCGRQLECNLNVLGNLIAGNDNVGIDATPENEPGNQMAGFDLRWASPVGPWPYAIYAQYIGEDESSYLPAKYIAQIGVEGWKATPVGALFQWHAEYTNTTCSALSSSGPYINCAYNQGRFNIEGYRYRGRVVGHTTDNDAESYAAGVTYTSESGGVWTLTARSSRLNNKGFDIRNSLSPVPADYAALEAGWRGKVFGQSLALEVGAESFEAEGADREVDPYGFISWKFDFR